MCATTPFKRLILRAVRRDVYPMVIRLVAVPDGLELADFGDIFHAVLGWDGGIGYAFQVQGQEFNSFHTHCKDCLLYTSKPLGRKRTEECTATLSPRQG